MEKDVLNLLKADGNHFSKGQKRIAAFILENYEKVAFMTAGRLGELSGVSESTVVRFASELGYDGYPGMRKALQKLVRCRLTSLQRIEAARETLSEEHILETVMRADIAMLQDTLTDYDRKRFDEAVDRLLGANHVYIVGMRSSSCLAGFLGYYLNLLLENVYVVQDTAASEVYEQLIRIRVGDVFVGITYPRYSRRSVKAMQFAKTNGAYAIGVTDGENSPFTGVADNLLYARSGMASFVDSLTAPMSLMNALIVAVGARTKADLTNTLGTLESVWRDYEVYQTGEN